MKQKKFIEKMRLNRLRICEKLKMLQEEEDLKEAQKAQYEAKQQLERECAKDPSHSPLCEEEAYFGSLALTVLVLLFRDE